MTCTSETIIVQKGDTLHGIAERLTGDGNRWPELAELNRSRLPKGPHRINIGDALVIPREWVPLTGETG
jgi:nucleoid-associated protein YgaU